MVRRYLYTIPAKGSKEINTNSLIVNYAITIYNTSSTVTFELPDGSLSPGLLRLVYDERCIECGSSGLKVAAARINSVARTEKLYKCPWAGHHKFATTVASVIH